MRDSKTLALYGPILLIIGGLLAWGAFHALGAYLSLAQRPGWASPPVPGMQGAPSQEGADSQAPRRDPRKAVVVGVCVAGFIAFWSLAMLSAHRRRARAARRKAEEAELAGELPRREVQASDAGDSVTAKAGSASGGPPDAVSAAGGSREPS